jgi:hypothetical protein
VRVEIDQTKPELPTPLDLRVTFRRQPPDEEVLHFIRRCARQRAPHGVRLKLVVERALGQAIVHLYAGHTGCQVVTERDPDVLLAVRNAFDRLLLSR